MKIEAARNMTKRARRPKQARELEKVDVHKQVAKVLGISVRRKP